MKCPHCGAEISDSAKFCENCGAPIAHKEAEETRSAASGPEVSEDQKAEDQTVEKPDKPESRVVVSHPKLEGKAKKADKPKKTKSKLQNILKWVLIILGVLVALLVVLVIIAMGKVQSEKVIYSEADYTRVSVFDNALSVDVPKEWQSGKNTDQELQLTTIDYQTPEEQDRCVIQLGTGSIDGLTASNMANDALDALVQQLFDSEDSLDATEVEIDSSAVLGMPARTITYESENDTDDTYKSKMVILAAYQKLYYVVGSWDIDAVSDYSDVVDHVIDSIKVAREQTLDYAENTIVSIEAAYTGDTEAGVVLDAKNTGIQVNGICVNGSTKQISQFTIETPATLQASKSSTVTITYDDFSTELTVMCTTEDPQVFKDSCQSISYDALARNPDQYTGDNIVIYGRVLQVIEGANGLINMRIATLDDGYGYYDDVVYVVYTYQAGESKILEDDMVTIYGTYTGDYSYETVLGSKITIPSMVAKYIE